MTERASIPDTGDPVDRDEIARRAVKRGLCALAMAVAFGALAWWGITSSRGEGRIAAIWLPNAVMVAIGLATRQSMPCVLVPALLGNIAANLLVGDGWFRAAGLSTLNALEIAITFGLSRTFIERSAAMRQPRILGRYILVAALAASLSGLGASLFFSLEDQLANPLESWVEWSLSDGLSLISVTPLLLLIHASWLRSRYDQQPMLTWQAVGELGIGCVAAAAIFAQSSFPFLFLVPPIALFIASRHGAASAAIMLLLTGILAIGFTVAGRGPIHLVSGGIHLKATVLQIFLLSTFVTTLPFILISERTLALRARMQSLLDAMDEVAFAIDRAGRWAFINNRWSQLMESPVEDQIGRRALRIVPRHLRSHLLAEIRELHEGLREVARFDFYPECGLSRPLHMRCRIKAMRDPNGDLEGLTGTMTDITRETEAIQARQESELRMSKLAEFAPVGIFNTAPDGTCAFVNDAWCGMAGIPLEQSLGTGWTRAVHPEDRPRVAREWDETCQQEIDADMEFRFRRPDGHVTFVRVVATPLRDATGALQSYIGVVVDQTREREARRSLSMALEKARASAEAKERFLAHMSHELRTPMNGVLGFADRLLDTDLRPDQTQYAALIRDSGEMMLELLNEILDMSRLAEGGLHTVKAPFDPRAMLKDLCEQYAVLSATSPVRFMHNIAADVPEAAFGDRQRTIQILGNILNNARKFTEEGWISLEARMDDAHQLVIDVSDTGIGIAPEQADRIFEQFSQATLETSLTYGGAGLGLTIARGLAERMGGFLELVASTPGKGSIFRLSVPLGCAPDEGTPAPSETGLPHVPPESEMAVTTGGSRRPERFPFKVLVAEDHEINQLLIENILRSFDCDITMASDGKEAVEAVLAARGQRPFDIVFMDVRMPVMDGLCAARKLRDEGVPAEELPIIAVTANAFEKDVEKSLAAGMQDHIAKPLTSEAIAAVLRELAQLRSQEPGSRTETRPLPKALRDLVPKFAAERNHCDVLLEDVLASWPESSADQIAQLQEAVHNLAGLAGVFQSEELAKAAALVDQVLDTPDAPLLPVALEDLQNALRSTLGRQIDPQGCSPGAERV